MNYLTQDTIVALATPNGTGAIGVIRLSGPDALIIANNAKFDVFNALTMMDNNLFLKETRVSYYFVFRSGLAHPSSSLLLAMDSSTFTFITGGLHRWQE